MGQPRLDDGELDAKWRKAVRGYVLMFIYPVGALGIGVGAAASWWLAGQEARNEARELQSQTSSKLDWESRAREIQDRVESQFGAMLQVAMDASVEAQRALTDAENSARAAKDALGSAQEAERVASGLFRGLELDGVSDAQGLIDAIAKSQPVIDAIHAARSGFESVRIPEATPLRVGVLEGSELTVHLRAKERVLVGFTGVFHNLSSKTGELRLRVSHQGKQLDWGAAKGRLLHEEIGWGVIPLVEEFVAQAAGDYTFRLVTDVHGGSGYKEEAVLRLGRMFAIR